MQLDTTNTKATQTQSQSSQETKCFVEINSSKNEQSHIEMIVYGFIHDIEHHYMFWYIIPDSIVSLCCLFYFETFFELELDRYKVGPFQILFALFSCRYTLSKIDWEIFDIEEQAKQLQQSNITTHSMRQHVANVLTSDSLANKEIMRMLSMYSYGIQSIQHKLPTDNWSVRDIIIAIVSYLIKNSALLVKNWEFLEYLRRYCNEEGYDGNSVLKDLNPYMQRNAAFVVLIKPVCKKYKLKSGAFAKMKRQIENWNIEMR